MTHPTLLINELCCLNDCDPRTLAFNIRKKLSKNLDFMKNIGRLFVSHAIQPYDVIPNNISKYSANQLYAFGTHRSRTTVEQYYLVKYGIQLRYPHLPCIIMNGGYLEDRTRHMSYFPIELIYVENKEKGLKELDDFSSIKLSE